MTRYLLACAILIVAFPLTARGQLMDPDLQGRLERALPRLASKLADDALHGRLPGRRLFYTGEEIEHAQQGDVKKTPGFYLSAHNRSANKDGNEGTDFEFPWKNPGGTDASDIYAWKVMFLPGNEKVRVHHTPLHSFFGVSGGNVLSGRGGVLNGLGWTFPDGTRFYELLAFGDRLTVFEVRARFKDQGKWRVNVYRPFVTRDDFQEVLSGESLVRLKKWTLTDTGMHRNRTAFNSEVVMEEIPGLESTAEVDALLRSRVFASALNRDWSEHSGSAPWSRSDKSIVPKDYNGAFVGNTTQACQRCHQDAGTHVRFFDADRQWYGFVRGEKNERILSFHPIDPSAISRSGGHVPVKLNAKLLAAGLIEDAIIREEPVVANRPAQQQPAYNLPRRLLRR